jgi:hypothetical protein
VLDVAIGEELEARVLEVVIAQPAMDAGDAGPRSRSAVTRWPPTRAPEASSSLPPMHMTSPSTRAVEPRITLPRWRRRCLHVAVDLDVAAQGEHVALDGLSFSMWMSEPIRTTSPAG